MRHLIALMSLIMVTTSTSAQYYDKEPSQNYVEVTGWATREIQPNKFTISITIREQENRGKQSLLEQERSIIKALNGAGIDSQQALRLKNNYSSNQRRSTAVEFREYELIIEGSERLNTAFAALDDLNLWSVQLSKAQCTNLAEIRRELRREAIREAQQRAKDLAEAIDQSIGECIHICDLSSGGDVGFYVRKAARNMDQSALYTADEAVESSTVEYTSQTISHNVSARFTLLK